MPNTEIGDPLPRWDLSNVYRGIDQPDFQQAVKDLEAKLSSLERLFDQHQVRRLAESPASADGNLPDVLVDVLRQTNDAALLGGTLESFVYSYVSTDSYNALAAQELSRLELLDLRRQKLDVRLKGWIGSLAPLLADLIGMRPALKDHAFFLRHTAAQSRYLMSEELEALAAELCIDSGGAFGKLQGNVTSQLKVRFERSGKAEELPITVVRNLCFDQDPQVREAAYRTELEGWKSIRTSVAACLNGVKGTALTLARRRGRPSVLDAALEANRIDRPMLDALLGSIHEALPVFRRYLKSKAAKLGRPRLAWWDLFAPLGAHMKMSWPEARSFIVEKFSTFSDELGAYAARAFDQRWIDAEPRDGKRGGAFCMGVLAVDESRVLMNFDGSFEQTVTLAHELGHGYHNHCQSGLEPLRRGAPSTLAETASIFCETLISEAALADAAADERLAILETQLIGATQVCLDIYSRYLFESAVFDRRAASELSADELCALMLDAQRKTYAEAVDESTYHPYMWLWKPHYYAYTENFYNFPYAFGHLFGLGLYARYREEGKSFVPRYRDLLRSTGQEYAAPLAKRFGIDITTPDFWRQSLAVVEGQVRSYEAA